MKEKSQEHISRREFLKKGCKLGLGIVVASGVSGLALLNEGCGGTSEEGFKRELEEYGLSGDHDIIDLRTVPGFNFSDEVSSGFLFTQREINGHSESAVQFAWKWEKDEVSKTIISEVPIGKILFNTDVPDKTKPTINMEFNLAALHADSRNEAAPIRKEPVSDDYLKLNPDNPSTYLP